MIQADLSRSQVYHVPKHSHPNVLVFDSGVGGLSVYQEIAAQLPQLNYIYLFDNEAYPYGELPQDRLLDRVERLVTAAVIKESIDLVVIACNTASTIVLPSLRSKLDIPIVGVVPAIKPASLISLKAVGLIATPATITRQYTHDLIRHFSHNKNVELLGSTVLVEMAEGKLRGQAVNLDQLEQILRPLINTIDVAVLGCTHFPLIREEIGMVLGSKVTLIDSGKAIAERVKVLLNLERGIEHHQPHKIYSSAPLIQEGTLSEYLSELGFGPIETFPIQGV
jgi:glutamate racemase